MRFSIQIWSMDQFEKFNLFARVQTKHMNQIVLHMQFENLSSGSNWICLVCIVLLRMKLYWSWSRVGKIHDFYLANFSFRLRFDANIGPKRDYYRSNRMILTRPLLFLLTWELCGKCVQNWPLANSLSVNNPQSQ